MTTLNHEKDKLHELIETRKVFRTYKSTPFVTQALHLVNKQIRNTRKRIKRREQRA